MQDQATWSLAGLNDEEVRLVECTQSAWEMEDKAED